MDQDLEILYSPSRWSKRFNNNVEVLNHHIQVLTERSREAREKIPCQLDVPYGPKSREKFDIYGTDLPNDSPLLIYIHGGYYQENVITHSNNGLVSNVLYHNGIKTILIGYQLCPERTLKELLQNLQIGLRECLKYTQSRAVYLSGHSAGAHAIASFLTNFKTSLSSEDQEKIKGAFLLGGFYDLEPLTRTSINNLLNLSVEDVEELNQLIKKSDYGNTVIYVLAAQNDSPAFVEQSKKFYEKLKSDRAHCVFKILPEVDHFDMVENLYSPSFELTELIVNVINKIA